MEIRVVETFYSIQGEGYYVGVPSVFLRLWGCNFTCEGFSSHVVPIIRNKPIDLIDLNQINEQEFVSGCDTRYSWDKSYRHLVRKLDSSAVIEELTSLIPTGLKPHLVVTGGEPLLQQKALSVLLHPLSELFSCITFETNGSVSLDPSFLSILLQSFGKNVLFSNSVKLEHSGEEQNKRLNFHALASQVTVARPVGFRRGIISNPELFDRQTFKFVVRPCEYDFKEIMDIIEQYVHYLYKSYYIENVEPNVWVMPLGADREQLQTNGRTVADLALRYGFNFSPRLHIDLFGNTVGT